MILTASPKMYQLGPLYLTNHFLKHVYLEKGNKYSNLKQPLVTMELTDRLICASKCKISLNNLSLTIHSRLPQKLNLELERVQLRQLKKDLKLIIQWLGITSKIRILVTSHKSGPDFYIKSILLSRSRIAPRM